MSGHFQSALTMPLETLELLHRDLFDRLLIVQARHEGLRLLTVDDEVLAYRSPTVDVRS